MNLANIVVFTKAKYFLLFQLLRTLSRTPMIQAFLRENLVTVDIRKAKTFQIHVMFTSKFYCKK